MIFEYWLDGETDMFGDVHVQKYKKHAKKCSSFELMEIKHKDALSRLGNSYIRGPRKLRGV